MDNSGSLYPKFSLGSTLTEEQIRYFDVHGFIHFKGFLNADELNKVHDSMKELQDKWLSEGVKHVNGTPLGFGVDHEGKTIIHRFAFTSLYNPVVHELVSGPKIQLLKELLGRKDGRIGENEKDGVVVNQYINTGKSKLKQMGWHTDSLRDVFMGQKLMPMLNVGIYLSDSKSEQGGLKVLAGTHKQGMFKMLFRKKYFISSKPDRKEVSIVADEGDLTVHHGHIWHRVAQAPVVGDMSKRITMYIPIVCGKYKPKNESSRTPIYHRMRFLAKK